MKKLFLGLSLVGGLFVSGCATNHDWEKKRMTEFSSKVFEPQNYNETARKRILNNVRDKATTKIKLFSGPKIGAFTPFMGDESYGYVVCYNVDTKNILRTYTGNRLYLYIFHNEKVMLEAIQSGMDPVTDKRIAETCTKAL